MRKGFLDGLALKPVSGWVLSWTLFWIGDAASKIMNNSPDWFPEIYFDIFGFVYQKSMAASSECQDRLGGKGPWKKIATDVK